MWMLSRILPHRPFAQAMYLVVVQTTFCTDKFGLDNITDPNDKKIHMIIYLQVAQISQALVRLHRIRIARADVRSLDSQRAQIFVTRAHSWFFVERPSTALFLAFCLAQLISSIIAAYGDWGFSAVEGISGGYIGFIWIWNIIWSVLFLRVVSPSLSVNPPVPLQVLPSRPHQVRHARSHRHVQRQARQEGPRGN
jgi:hypothetical protein